MLCAWKELSQLTRERKGRGEREREREHRSGPVETGGWGLNMNSGGSKKARNSREE